METVSFTRMEDGSREDYLLLDQLEREHASGTADRVLEQLLQRRNVNVDVEPGGYLLKGVRPMTLFSGRPVE